MNACSQCQRLYPTGAGFCPVDGNALAPIGEVTVPPDPEDPRIGVMVCKGRYHIRRKVADGGMGRVYQAVDTEQARSVAVKILHAEVAIDDVALERFKREYALSAELPHQHIVEVLDFRRTEDGSFALVMEYLEGEELRHFLKREKTMPVGRLLRVLAQLAAGLKEPHAMKLVHRDIKPDNIFLCGTADGPHVKLLDFGSVRDNSEGAKKLTMIGTTIGSPYYMSPEQAQGLQELDHRADVWSVATIAYECLTGTVPFPGSTGPQILLAILGNEPSPLAMVLPEGVVVPHELDDVFADALAKEVSTRLVSVAALADRFGAAYGLPAQHQQWAYRPENELQAMVDEFLRELPPPASGRDTKLISMPENDQPFQEDDIVMGVPEPAPVGLYVGIAVATLAAALGAAIAFFLL